MKKKIKDIRYKSTPQTPATETFKGEWSKFFMY